MFNFTIPADGSSVPAADFAAHAKAVLESLEDKFVGDEKAVARTAVDAATAIIKAGHLGAAHVYAVIGGHKQTASTPGLEDLVAVSVYARPAPAKPVPVLEAAPAPPVRTPYETGPTQGEIAREAANTGTTPEQAAAALGAAAPTQPAAKKAAPASKPAPRKPKKA